MNLTQKPPAPDHHRFDRRIEDVGNIVEFGHINLLVPDQHRAVIFYVMGLGLTRDPYLVTGVDNAWINVGTCQFHLPVGRAQVLRGTIGLVMSDLDGLTTRLQSIRPRLQGTAFSFERHGAQVDVVCPWGNRIRVHAPDRARFGPGGHVCRNTGVTGLPAAQKTRMPPIEIELKFLATLACCGDIAILKLKRGLSSLPVYVKIEFLPGRAFVSSCS